MMLWDIIRDWFVMNIWGGITSLGEDYYCNLGWVDSPANDSPQVVNTNDTFIKIGSFWWTGGSEEMTYMSLGDWLSTTSTIIVLIAVCVALFFLVRYFFRMFAGLLSGR